MTKDKIGLSERLGRTETELERQDALVGLLFTGMAITTLAAIIALAMALQALGELREVAEQLDLLRSRLTEITAEIRGIGG